MKNTGTILLSAGVLFVGFSLFTPLLFFLIGALLDNSYDTSILLQMEYAFLSCIGVVLLVLGSILSLNVSLARILSAIISSSLVILAYVVSFAIKDGAGLFAWIVTACHYLALVTAFGIGISILHTKHPDQG